MATARTYTSTTRVVTLITGANRGLGFTLAQQLLRRGGYHVIAAARKWTTEAGSAHNILDAAYSEASKTPTRHLGGLDFVELDVASPASRYTLQGQLAGILGTEQRLNVLVNNAGVYLNEWTADAFERSMSTNCIGPLSLSEELVPFYAPDAHVVNVSTGFAQLRHVSAAYKAAITAAKSIEDLKSTVIFRADDKEMSETAVGAYKVSKAALNQGTKILAAKHKGVARFTAVDPGWCQTDMQVVQQSIVAFMTRSRGTVCKHTLICRGGAGAPRSARDGALSIYAAIVGDQGVIGTGNFFNSAGKPHTWE